MRTPVCPCKIQSHVKTIYGIDKMESLTSIKNNWVTSGDVTLKSDTWMCGDIDLKML